MSNAIDGKATKEIKTTKQSTNGEFTRAKYTKVGGPKGDWKCHLCKYNLATEKWTYTGGTLEPGFKLSCNDCKDSNYGIKFFSSGCNIVDLPDIKE
jgi:transposase-like protein